MTKRLSGLLKWKYATQLCHWRITDVLLKYRPTDDWFYVFYLENQRYVVHVRLTNTCPIFTTICLRTSKGLSMGGFDNEKSYHIFTMKLNRFISY